MMELQRLWALVVDTEHTLAACLFNQDPLDLPATTRHLFDSALPAPIRAAALQDKGGQSVARTVQVRFSRAVFRAAVPIPRCLHLVLPHPVPDRRQAAIRPPRDGSQR